LVEGRRRLRRRSLTYWAFVRPAKPAEHRVYDRAVRSVEELRSGDSAWPVVESWLAEVVNEVVVLPAEPGRGEEALYRLQVTTASPLGAVALETAGILVDRGWLRLLGAGSDELRGLAAWNGVGEPALGETLDDAFLVAHDAVGGFFALNGGAFGGAQGDVFYFAPDTLAWEPLDRGYGDFVYWALAGDVQEFYAGLRWPGWQRELSAARADEGFSLYPPPFSREGRALEVSHRKLVPMTELWAFHRDVARQLAAVPEGESFRIRIDG
jgi:Protein of unknown function DUF2625